MRGTFGYFIPGGGSKFWISIFLGVSEKKMGGMKILWMFFWGHHKIGLYLRVILMHFKSLFLRSRYRMRIFFFLGLLKSQIFFFWGGGA